MLKHGFFTVAKASSCGMNQAEYHKKVMVFMVDNQPRIIHGWWDDKEFVSRYYSNILHYPDSTTISYERIFLLIPPLPPFSLAIHVPKEKSKEMALESIPSASWGFADSPYDVAISHQSPPLCICPVVPARLSLCTPNSFSHPLMAPQYLYLQLLLQATLSPVILAMQIWSSIICPFFILCSRLKRGNCHIGPSLAPFWLIFPCQKFLIKGIHWFHFVRGIIFLLATSPNIPNNLNFTLNNHYKKICIVPTCVHAPWKKCKMLHFDQGPNLLMEGQLRVTSLMLHIWKHFKANNKSV